MNELIKMLAVIVNAYLFVVFPYLMVKDHYFNRIETKEGDKL